MRISLIFYFIRPTITTNADMKKWEPYSYN